MASVARRAERQFGLVTSADLASCGVAPRQITRWLDAGRLVSHARGVFRIAGSPLTTDVRILAAVLVHGPDTWASHRTAAWLWQIEGFGRPGRVELVRPASTSNERSSALVHRSTLLLPHHRAKVGPIPVTSLSRTLFDLASQVGPKPLGRAIESGLRTSSCSIGSLYRVAEELGGRGRPGTVAMREALAERGRDYIPTESELDVLGRAVVSTIPGIEWQVPLSDGRGYIRRVDGLHRRASVVIEWDGAAYHDTPEQRALDAAGDARLHACGYRVLRYDWDAVTLTPAEVRAEVARLVAARVGPRAAA